MKSVSKPRNVKTLTIKLLIDCAITVAFLALLSIPLTGLAVHEWLGIGFIFGLIVHLLLNWAWIVATTRRFLRALPDQVRINYLLNSALFIMMAIVITSGLMISEQALPFLGLHPTRNMFLSVVHLVSADALLIIVGLHLGLNWKWVVKASRSLLIAPIHAHMNIPMIPVSPQLSESKAKTK